MVHLPYYVRISAVTKKEKKNISPKGLRMCETVATTLFAEECVHKIYCRSTYVNVYVSVFQSLFFTYFFTEDSLQYST
jgi:hypothetical protein